ncbi:hypothetical protein [Paenibacillus polymyxa]
MTRTSASPEGFATDQMAQYYASFAHMADLVWFDYC